MKNDRLRIVVDDPYVMALGRATYVFAILEWNAVWCAERLDPGFIPGLTERQQGALPTIC
jgi:hypothetical protein